jgi:hypothetical protein
MASVAICPHCYLQLIVPDDVEHDALVECPTCAKEFDLGHAVLRDIPAVVHVERVRVAEREAKQVAAEVEAQIETDVIQEIQARIEAEIAENGLHAGVRVLPPVESPETHSEFVSDTEEPADFENAAWFQEQESEAAVDLPLAAAEDAVELAKTQAADEVVRVAEFIEVERIEEVAEIALEPVEAEAEKVEPAAVTLADLIPPRRQPEESESLRESLPGPSFDLPNVRLTPDNSATIEIDPSMSFGPVGETEFELEDVDFESMAADEAVSADEAVAAEAAVYCEPDFREPTPAGEGNEPFELPKLPPRKKKKRSVARTLVGFASSSVVGLSLGYLALLYILGPDGDVLHVAQYMPSAVLPKVFQSAPMRIAEVTEPPTELVGAATEPVSEEPVVEESIVEETIVEDTEIANVPASYVEESPAAALPLATDAAAEDDRNDSASLPSPLEEPVATPIAAAPAPRPLSGPTYTVEQLQTVLDAGEQAKSGLVTGDLSDAAVRRTKGMSYAKLCDLAQALVFLDRSSPTDESEELKQRADRLFGEILADARVRDEVNRVAAIWIDSPHRRHGGVFLAGNLSGGQIAGDVYEYQLTDARGDRLALVMQEPVDPLIDGSDHPLGIVGTIVDNPVEQIAGYRGTASRAIWVESTIPLE